MKKNRYTLYFCFSFTYLLFFVIACNQSDKSKVKPNYKETTVASSINPNGDSELALLMRKLFYDTDSLRQSILADDFVIHGNFIQQLEQIHSAIPTDSTVKTPAFESFNNALINQANRLQTAEDKVDVFNKLVNSCIDCHQTVCPGPIKRIKQLIIN